MLILASQSPTRKALLQQAGIAFSTAPAPIDERQLEATAVAGGADGREVAVALARAKAMTVARLHQGAVVIGADQTLAFGAELLHKPQTMADAGRQLDQLRGQTHHLYAAVALMRDGQELWSGVETAELTMRKFATTERDAVLALEGDAVLGSVGGYRLEGPSIRLFSAVNGDYFTILGLPLLPLLAALREHAPQYLLGSPAP